MQIFDDWTVGSYEQAIAALLLESSCLLTGYIFSYFLEEVKADASQRAGCLAAGLLRKEAAGSTGISELPGASQRASSERRSIRGGGLGTGGWHDVGAPIESIRKGDKMQGIVTNVAPFGAFVDVGAARNAKILIESRLWKQFHVGDRIDECVVKEVELDKRRFCVTLQNAEAAIAENRVPLEDLREGDLVPINLLMQSIAALK
ncbi:hypothetical protein AK812_SmicGene18035 [Symbiodinium microadriaticum]|uniref:S1 motif domain-containing protein n=1 Tax=Symbiodinium microadriaticum TaxID=2951 RepID=A0A1Q9DW43_SYMMI|nr:hypothetical protein AK812_SmicGene18035 [Symbiodinium microadriaticum]